MIQIAGGITIFLLSVIVSLQTGSQRPSTDTALATQAPTRYVSSDMPEANQQKVVKEYGKLPLSFEANQGQSDHQVMFLSRGSGYNLFLTPSEAVLSLSKPAEVDARHKHERDIPLTTTDPGHTQAAALAMLRTQLIGANPAPRVSGHDELPGVSHYLIGDNPDKWHTNIPHYAKVRHEDVYPGVDLIYYGNQRQLEYDFIVAPGIDPNVIKLNFEGAEKLELDEEGDLVIYASGGELRQRKPVIYQGVDGEKETVSGGYVLHDEHKVTFDLGDYDENKPLVIDPVLSYSTYLGGINQDHVSGIAVDGSGSALITGHTLSTNFPTLNSVQGSKSSNWDVFVTKLDPSGSALVYSTYLGGSLQDFGHDIAVDGSGNAYVTGQIWSYDFPVTPGAYQTTHYGSYNDAMIAKLAPSGSLVYSTYIGGSRGEYGYGIAVDIAGSAYITGAVNSYNFPITPGAFQTSIRGGIHDSYVTKLNPSGTALVYSTFLGGSGQDAGRRIAVDNSGNAYVTGRTASTNFPRVNALQSTHGGGPGILSYTGPNDGFVSKLNASGSALIYSTFLGGNGYDQTYSITADAVGNAYITGFTTSTNFPTMNAVQPTHHGGIYDYDAFVTKLDPTGSNYVFSTYLGGSGYDVGHIDGIAFDGIGNVYICGTTASSDFPIVNALQAANAGSNDGFVTVLDASGSSFIFSSYLGGASSDVAVGIALDGSGSIYLSGSTQSGDFPTLNPLQASHSGGSDVFVAKITFNKPPLADAGLDQTVIVGQTVQLNGSASSDPDGDLLTFDWTITTQPASSTLSDPSIVNPTFVTDVAGEYVVELIVNDGTVDSDPDQVTITIQTPQEATQDVIDAVADLAAGVLNAGQGNALASKLDGVIKQLNKGKTKTALNQLGAFINHVNSLIDEGVLSLEEGQPLLSAANAIITGLGGGAAKPALAPEGMAFDMSNYPNPANPSTTIRYALTEATDVRLAIYNILGQQVRVLVNSEQSAGTYSVVWDGRNALGREVTSGVYLYRLKAGQNVAIRKMILIK